MKKIVVLAFISMVSVNCMAGEHGRTISITNNTENTIDVRDRDNHQVSIDPGRSASLSIIVHEPHGSFPIPSSVMPHVTEITVSDAKGSNSIDIDEHTKTVTVDSGLKLSQKKSW